METEKDPSPSKRFLPLAGHEHRSQRFWVDLPLLKNRFSPKTAAVLRNLSKGGGFIETVPKRCGGLIDVEFSFPGQQDFFHILGRIKWCQGENKFDKTPEKLMGMGIEFLRFLKGTPEYLQTLLKTWDELHAAVPSRNHLKIIENALPEAKTGPENDESLIQIPCDLLEEEIEAILKFLDSRIGLLPKR